MHNLLIQSMQKNLILSTRAFQTSFKKILTRIKAYLSGVYLDTVKTEFDIPFDRQE